MKIKGWHLAAVGVFLFLRNRAGAAGPTGFLQKRQPSSVSQPGYIPFGQLPEDYFSQEKLSTEPSYMFELQEAAAVQESIAQKEATAGPAPSGYRYVQTDSGVGIVPTQPISEAAAIERLPAGTFVEPGRVQYQAASGIPILTSEQYEAEVGREIPYVPTSVLREQRQAAQEAAAAEEIVYQGRAIDNPALIKLLRARGKI